MQVINSRHFIDIAYLFREYGGRYLDNHTLCVDQLKAFHAISACRTSAMGGHLQRCNYCDHQRIAYNSCRNRNCNKCQYTKQLVWIDKLKSNLPVCPYFHIVFTIPSQLHTLFYLNQRTCYNLLFKAASQTLRKLAANPKFLGAQTGAVAVLHTWGQALTYHPHIHMLIPAGGLSMDGMEWVKAKRNFFLPVKVLSKVFRGLMWSLVENQINVGKIRLPDGLELASITEQLYAKNWHVYSKKSLVGPQAVVQYLGKYTHRVAISNSRLVSSQDGKITFRCKDYRTGQANGLHTLDAQEFIARFMRHVLPGGFYKIRYYGLLASSNGKQRLRCFALINKPLPLALLQGLTARQVYKIVPGKDSDACPKCKKGRLMPHTILDPV